MQDSEEDTHVDIGAERVRTFEFTVIDKLDIGDCIIM